MSDRTHKISIVLLSMGIAALIISAAMNHSHTTPTPPPVQAAVQDGLTKRQVVALEILSARMGYAHKYPFTTKEEVSFAYSIADCFLEGGE